MILLSGPAKGQFPVLLQICLSEFTYPFPILGGCCDTQQQLRLGVIQTRKILVCWHQLNPSLSETKVHKVCVF